ncbi:hypothetical protein SOPP22_16910 [Shewanella sp. OPT22]|nr:hypothetical protein SOPP22_16910 [Shewanella sp. OPT22]
MDLHRFSLIVLVSFLLIGCNEKANKITKAQKISHEGRVINNTLYNAKVCLDCNSNTLCDDSESMVFTDKNSHFTFNSVSSEQVKQCSIVAEITNNSIDMNTGLKINLPYRLIAEPRSTVVSMFSTMQHYHSHKKFGANYSKKALNKKYKLDFSMASDYMSILKTANNNSKEYAEALHMKHMSNVMAGVLAENLSNINELMSENVSEVAESTDLFSDENILNLILMFMSGNLNELHSSLELIGTNKQSGINVNFYDIHKTALLDTIIAMSVPITDEITNSNTSSIKFNSETVSSIFNPFFVLRNLLNVQRAMANSTPTNFLNALFEAEAHQIGLNILQHNRTSTQRIFSSQDAEEENYTFTTYRAMEDGSGITRIDNDGNFIFGLGKFNGATMLTSAGEVNLSKNLSISRDTNNGNDYLVQDLHNNQINFVVDAMQHSVAGLDINSLLRLHSELDTWLLPTDRAFRLDSTGNAYNLNLRANNDVYLFNGFNKNTNIFNYGGYPSRYNQAVTVDIIRMFDTIDVFFLSTPEDLINKEQYGNCAGLLIGRSYEPTKLNYLCFKESSSGVKGLELWSLSPDTYNPPSLERVITSEETESLWEIRSINEKSVMVVRIPQDIRREYSSIFKDFSEPFILTSKESVQFDGRSVNYLFIGELIEQGTRIEGGKLGFNDSALNELIEE